MICAHCGGTIRNDTTFTFRNGKNGEPGKAFHPGCIKDHCPSPAATQRCRVTRECDQPDCTIRPTFTTGALVWCVHHKPEGAAWRMDASRSFGKPGATE